MHISLFYISAIWITLLFVVTAILIIRARTPLSRLLAFDTLTVLLIALVVLFVRVTRSWYYLDAVLLIAMLSFISTVTAARYYSEGKIF